MKRHSILSLLISSFVFSLALSPNLQASQRGYGKMKGESREELFERLNLTDEQKEQVKALRKKHREEMKAMRGEGHSQKEGLRKAHKKLREMMQGDASNAALKEEFKRLQKMKEEAHKRRQKKSLKRFENSLEIRALLTPEQRKEFRGFMREHGQKQKKKRGHRNRRNDD